MILKVKKLNPDAVIPSYAHGGDSGFDLYSIEDKIIWKGRYDVVKTGLSFEIPRGYELQIRPKSGLTSKFGLTVLNTPGTVDSSYRGEIGVILINHGLDTYYVKKGDKIAQGVINKIEEASIQLADDLSETSRGSGGFGSTGK